MRFFRVTVTASCLSVLMGYASATTDTLASTSAFLDIDADHAETAIDRTADEHQPDRLGQMLQEKNLVDTQAISEHWKSDVVLSAMSYLGVPYRSGGDNEKFGFDCSGFTRFIYTQVLGIQLPRRASEQAQSTSMQSIDKNQLQAGDLVFFNTLRRMFSHVGIYIGDNKFIHAPRSGKVVRIEDMGISYWQQRFNGARRILIDNDHSAP